MSKLAEQLRHTQSMLSQNTDNTALAALDIDQDKWLRFSEIQCAVNLVIDKHSIARYRLWIESGNDEDAWS